MSRLIKKIKYNSGGLTLIEIIIALAMLGIIAVVFLSTFSSGMKWTFFAGHRTKAAMSARNAMDSVYYTSETTPLAETVDDIVQNHLAVPEVTSKSTAPSTLQINGITPPGTTVTLTCTVNGQQVTVIAYVPK